ncbi:hypothetical protein ACFL3V_04490 [Nanoarchaeota archaeon]
MVYHFFKKWKGIKSAVFSLKEEISSAEKVYRLKIKLFNNIWHALEDEKIDFKDSRRLLKIYSHEKHSNPYEVMQKKLYEVSTEGLLDKHEVDSFRHLVDRLQDEVAEQVDLAVRVLEQLISGKLPPKSHFYRLKEMLTSESEFLKVEGEAFRKIEEVFLIKNDPGSVSGGYVQIFKAITSGLVKFDKDKFWVEGKPMQGIKVKHNRIILKGDHYAPLQNAQWIAGDMYVKPSLADPYSYFVERGKLAGISTKKVQKALGISDATAIVSLEIEIFPEQLYVKIKKGMPTKFAIAQLRQSQVNKVIKEAEMVAA